MRAALLLLWLPLAGGTALAEGRAAEAAHERPEPRIQRIRVEDAGSRVDELRVSGQTQRITVQPRANVPAYEVQPADGPRGGSPSRESAPGATGPRVWNLLKF